MRCWIRLGLVLLLLNLRLFAEQVPRFEDGERICFVGDSITHGGAYHSYVYLYYLTRFPEREIRVWNRGISGNQASHVLRRFDEDIASVKPSVSTVMLGMNDVGRSLYEAEGNDEESKRNQQLALDRYIKNMRMLLVKFDAIGSETILITPSIYDQTADLPTHNHYGVNDGLGRCADFIRSMALKREDGLVDFYGLMGDLNAELQQEDPSATVVGPDRVHPQAGLGHFIMAYQFLKAQGVPRLVSKMVIDAESAVVAQNENCRVTDVEFACGVLSFSAHEFALPFPQSDSIKEALALVPFEQEMNQQILSVRNLPAGEYLLCIDDVEVGSWSAFRLAAGVNLAVNRNTPQYRQALRIQKLSEKQSALQSQLRSAAFVFYGSGLSESDINRDSREAVQAFLARKLKLHEGQSHYGYFKKNYEAYLELMVKEKQIGEEIEALHIELNTLNKPEPHRFSLRARQ